MNIMNIMNIRNIARWLWTSYEAMLPGFKGARPLQQPVRRWYPGFDLNWIFICVFFYLCSKVLHQVQAVQVHLREGDCDVRLLQEARLLLHRVHLQPQCLQVWDWLEIRTIDPDGFQRLRASLYKRCWEDQSDRHHWHHSFWRAGICKRISHERKFF